MATNISIVNISEANAITHGGIFHGDDVFATALLGYLLPYVRIARVFKVEGENPDAIVYDIGMVYNSDENRFDHHQRGFEEAYDDGILMSSFGLLWKHYGAKVLRDQGLEEELIPVAHKYVINNLVKGVDAQDNGQLVSKDCCLNISGAISQFNPNFDDEFTTNEAFLKAVEFAQIVLSNTIRKAISQAKGNAIVEEAICKSKNGIMTLPFFVPWQGVVAHNPNAQKILYVIYRSLRGGYNVQGVPKDPAKGNELRKPLPEEWAGLTNTLPEVTGIKDATFCHKGRFLCTAKTLEGAQRLAELAVAD